MGASPGNELCETVRIVLYTHRPQGGASKPSTQPAAPAAIICGEAATTTLGAEGPVKLKNPTAKGRSLLQILTPLGRV